MSIRSATANDHWRKALSRTYINRYTQLGYSRLFCLGQGEIKFNGGLSAIVGGNGVGKSTLAAALGELLETQLAERFVGERARLGGSELDGVIMEGTTAKSRKASGMSENRKLDGDSIEIESWWLDPGYWAFHTRMQVNHDQNFPDLIEPLSSRILDQKKLEMLSYVVGKSYEECRVFEIQDYANLDRFPYFKVKANNVEYGSEGMGQGELALMLILWVLDDLRTNSILILEEPESHVSPKSQAALMNVLAEAVANKGLWTIITTHSPTIAARIPNEHLRLLVREGNQISIIDSVKRHQVASVLGGGQNYDGIMLVEDDVAKEFTVAILDEFAPDLLRQVEVLVAGGEARIFAALEAFPKGRGWLRLIGIFDGDQRGKIVEDRLNWPISYLPGDVDPAILLRDTVVMTAATDALASELRKDRAKILATFNAFTGIEPRDWIIECARELTISKTEFVRALFRVWIQSTDCQKLASDFVAAVTKNYDNGKPLNQ